MLALLVPGVGMGGGTAAEPPVTPEIGGHAFGKRTRVWQPYLAAVLVLLGVILG